MRLHDLRNSIFGRLTVLSREPNGNGGHGRWLCRCECGSSTTVSAHNLKKGHVQSCGCLQVQRAVAANRKDRVGEKHCLLTVMSRVEGTTWLCLCDCGNSKLIDTSKLKATQSCGCALSATISERCLVERTGERYGRWIVVERGANDRHGHVRWRCLCDCGNEKLVDVGALARGLSRSCGCLKLERTVEANREDLTGQLIGQWEVLSPGPTNKRGGVTWLCEHIQAGVTRIFAAASLRIMKCPIKQMVSRLRTRTGLAFRHRSLRKQNTTLALLGCSGHDLAAHLASQFETGMALENYGEWEIDHIIPIASFDLSVAEQVQKCFHFSNLQPLWKRDNRDKSDRLDWERAVP